MFFGSTFLVVKGEKSLTPQLKSQDFSQLNFSTWDKASSYFSWLIRRHSNKKIKEKYHIIYKDMTFFFYLCHLNNLKLQSYAWIYTSIPSSCLHHFYHNSSKISNQVLTFVILWKCLRPLRHSDSKDCIEHQKKRRRTNT